MRTRQFRALAISVLLTLLLSTVPVTAAPRDSDGWVDREFPYIAKIIKKVKRTLGGVTTNADGLTLPKP